MDNVCMYKCCLMYIQLLYLYVIMLLSSSACMVVGRLSATFNLYAGYRKMCFFEELYIV
jgi:hypothetical protein